MQAPFRFCPVCRDPVNTLDTDSHLMVTKSNNGHVHVHGDVNQKENVQDMVDAIGEQAGVLPQVKALNIPKEVIFHNRQRIGDMLVFTCAVRDFKLAYPNTKVGVISTASHIWDYNPYVDETLEPFYSPEIMAKAAAESKNPLEIITDKDFPEHTNVVKIGPKRLTNSSNRLDWHFTNAYRISAEDALKLPIPQGESRPDIWLNEEEYNAPRVRVDPYWVICTAGEKGWGCKMYPFEKWQEFVNQNPDITFVQIGMSGDAHPRLQGANVIDYIGKTENRYTGLRDLFKLFLNAEGSIGLVSFHMHLSGALHKPCLVVAGAREPVHFTRYPGHAYLSTDGMMPCAVKACWHCDIKACTNQVIKGDQIIPKCVDMIEPEDLTRAIRGYYTGGRLVHGVPSKKPSQFRNISKAPSKPSRPQEPDIDPSVNTYGMTWGGGSLTDRDWAFIKQTIEKYGVRDVLEFGAGLSTLLLNDKLPSNVVTFETKQGWIDKIKQLNPNATIILWDGITHTDPVGGWDLVFVDGPAGDVGRQHSTAYAAQTSNIVIVHDAGREWARKYQDEYLKPGFDGPIKGGHRCHLWVKKGFKAPVVEKEAIVENSAPEPHLSPVGKNPGGVRHKTLKIVSTARGYGGCARSVATIMRLALKAGHRVEFIPFRNAVTSSEWKALLGNELKQVTVTADYSTVHEQCDVLLMYADDFIWDFGLPAIAQAFENIGADKKIMMLNYRRGKVGEIPWTKGWDKYMFLNSTQETELLKVHPGVKTKVLPPCTDLTPFFNVKPDYQSVIRIVRHSSQGDTKFQKEKEFKKSLLDILLGRPEAEIDMLPGPSFLASGNRFRKHPRTADPNQIAAFLGIGNLFWYSLPSGYMDMGPRVILEAMAAGLPILADNWGGAVDRVTHETGWLCDTKEEHIEVIKNVTVLDLQQKGEAARVRAFDEFRPEKWMEELFDA